MSKPLARFFGKKRQPSSGRPSTEDYEKLGRQVVALYDHINPDRRGLYRTAFLKGVVTGLGSVIGATLVVVVLAWVLSLLGQVPFIGDIFENVQNSLEGSR